MKKSIRAHFDGRVIVPDEPVDMPVNLPLEVRLESLAPEAAPGSRDGVSERLRALARAKGCVRGPTIPLEALRRENLYDERA